MMMLSQMSPASWQHLGCH